MAGGTDDYTDVVIFTADEKIVTWREFSIVVHVPTLLKVAKVIRDEGLQLQIEVPFSHVTCEAMKQYYSTQKVNDIQCEHAYTIVQELASYHESDFYTFKLKILDALLEILGQSNCISIWRICRTIRSSHVEKVKEYLGRYLFILVHDRNIDLNFFNLSVSELSELLSAEWLIIKSEVEIVEIINIWAAVDREERVRYVQDLAKCVRLHGLPSSVTDIFGIPLETLQLSSAPKRIVDDPVLVFGGWRSGPVPEILLFDQKTNDWITLNHNMPYKGAYHSVIYANEELYVFGGGDDRDRHYSEMFKLTKSLKWERMPPMFEPRCFISNSSCLWNNMIYVFGGHNSEQQRENRPQSTRLRTAECYNLATGRWRRLSNMHTARSDAAACAFGGRIFVIGGFTGIEVTRTVEVYDPENETFQQFAGLPEPRAGICCVATSNRLYVLGGFNGITRCNSVFYLERGSSSWMTGPPMLQARSNFSCSVINDNEIFVQGGFFEKVIANCEIFKNGAWCPKPPLPFAKSALCAVVVPHANAQRLLKSNTIRNVQSIF